MKRKKECLTKMPEYSEYCREWGEQEMAAFLEHVPREMLPSIFSETEIGQSTLNMSTTEKEDAQSQIARDEQELEQGKIKE